MGTNLNQVFILNNGSLYTESDYDGVTSGDVGIWTFGATDTYVGEALYATTVDTDTSNADDTTVAALTVANPLWLYTDLQIVQGVSGNPIASPIINTRSIRRIQFEPFEATAGHKTVLTPNATFTGATIGDVTIRVIARSVPTDYLSYYDGDGTDYTILSGTDQFPLGAYNTTNHKAISVEVRGADFTTAATFIDKAKEAIEAHGILNKLVAVTDGATTMTIQSKHVGFIFDVVVTKTSDNSDLIAGTAAANLLTETVTGQVLGVGNDWQVLGEELRCRYRQGNFNRMYLPQNPATLTKEDFQYHKITIEYEHNWPTSTGIAPAGTLNQAVIYAGDSSTAMVAGDTDVDETFALANVTAAQTFVW